MNVFERLYKELRRKYGPPKGQWSLWCKRPKTEREREEVMIGAILTQRTNWKNVDLAFSNLKREKAGLLKGILRLGPKKLRGLIKPSGFYKTKSQYLIGLARFVFKNYGSLAKMRESDCQELREQLLKLKGIGPETADSILLYALGKPIFVVDEYTRRLTEKRDLAKNLTYAFLQGLFEKNLRKDFQLYQDFHALIVIDGKNK
jgi:endonuclease-3 related protein